MEEFNQLVLLAKNLKQFTQLEVEIATSVMFNRLSNILYKMTFEKYHFENYQLAQVLQEAQQNPFQYLEEQIQILVFITTKHELMEFNSNLYKVAVVRVTLELRKYKIKTKFSLELRQKMEEYSFQESNMCLKNAFQSKLFQRDNYKFCKTRVVQSSNNKFRKHKPCSKNFRNNKIKKISHALQVPITKMRITLF